MSELDLYGPPGTGKTTRLTDIALKAVQTVSPDRLGAVTYTRAAAQELKGRIAASLGIRVPDSAHAARSLLDQTLPWVGTIHSLCYKLMGRPPMVSANDLIEFAKDMDPNNRADFRATPNPETIEGFEYGDAPAQDEIELALQLYAMSRHRRVSIDAAALFMSDRARMEMNVDRLAFIAGKYRAYKTDLGKIDFEDMLEQGSQLPIPATVLLCDEVQDNSSLLWSVIDKWAAGAELTVMAGDPWQAIYLYSGASPELFRNRQGKWITIGDSHRLSAATAAYALSLLRTAGYQDDSLLSTWQGVGGQPKDGTQFYLARTNALLRNVRENLEDQGEPYRLLRGTGPLQMKAAQAFRAIQKEPDQAFSIGTAALLADCIPDVTGTLPRGTKARWQRLAVDTPNMALSPEDQGLAEMALDRLPNRAYYERVFNRYGTAGMVLTPAISVGTIHAAKGREADQVTLVRSWGWLPGRAILDGHRKEEACVAYVGATRHRSGLSFLEGAPGIDYPFGPIGD